MPTYPPAAPNALLAANGNRTVIDECARVFLPHLVAFAAKANHRNPIARLMKQAAPADVAHATSRTIVGVLFHDFRIRDVAAKVSRRLAPLLKEPMDVALHYRTGIILVELFREATGAVRYDSLPRTGRGFCGAKILVPTQETWDWLERNRHLYDKPSWFPHAEPRAWAGRLSDERGRVIVAHDSAAVRQRTVVDLETLTDEERHAGAAPALLACDSQQRIGWRLNERLEKVARAAWTMDPGLADAPPADLHFEEGETKRARKALLERRLRWKAKRREHGLVLVQAEEIRGREAYWAWGADFRGRIHPFGRYMSPHGSDMGRAMLEFAQGRRIGDHGHHLARHGANLWGAYGWSFANRQSWVESYTDNILACARDPLENRWWTKAKDPWRFLAFCFEWEGFIRDGADHVCRMPVQIDATNSCFQIIALLLRSRPLALATNLVPDPEHPDTVRDLYTELSAKVSSRMLQLEDGEWPQQLLDQIGSRLPRPVVKAPLITLAYGGKLFGIADKIQNWLREQWDLEWPWPDAPPGRISSQITLILRDLVETLVPDLPNLCKWIRHWTSSAKVQRDGYAQWRTPSGFLVVSEYLGVESRQILTAFGSHNILEPTGAPNLKRLRKGMVANLEQSLDASVMHALLRRCEAEGLLAAAIHDCIGGHPEDMDRLYELVQDSVVEVFSGDVLADLAAQLDVEPFEVMCKDRFDISEILASDYMWT